MAHRFTGKPALNAAFPIEYPEYTNINTIANNTYLHPTSNKSALANTSQQAGHYIV
ncbi:hypothetical protein TUM3792_36070 [Shewanella sp. MBTL60-007]|nr:hypothetical protein TUM3792_36070 [Shewanella sp. MBTL60-007]